MAVRFDSAASGLLLEFGGDGLCRDLRRSDTENTHLGSGGEGR
jgi:hypothetical protein